MSLVRVESQYEDDDDEDDDDEDAARRRRRSTSVASRRAGRPDQRTRTTRAGCCRRTWWRCSSGSCCCCRCGSGWRRWWPRPTGQHLERPVRRPREAAGPPGAGPRRPQQRPATRSWSTGTRCCTLKGGGGGGKSQQQWLPATPSCRPTWLRRTARALPMPQEEVGNRLSWLRDRRRGRWHPHPRDGGRKSSVRGRCCSCTAGGCGSDRLRRGPRPAARPGRRTRGSLPALPGFGGTDGPPALAGMGPGRLRPAHRPGCWTSSKDRRAGADRRALVRRRGRVSSSPPRTRSGSAR